MSFQSIHKRQSLFLKESGECVPKRSFKNGKELYDKMQEYLQVCRMQMEFPNIAGFCVFCDITRETYYAQKNYYSDTIKKVEDLLEDAAINSKASDTWKIFYAKNKFGYRDRFVNEIEHTNPIDINVNMNKLSADELKQLKELTKKVKEE